MLAAALMMMPIAGCGMGGSGDDTPGIAGTGSGGARSYAAAGFSDVVLAGSDDVDVTIGSGFSVRAEGAAADLDRLRIRVENDTLTVDRRRVNGTWSSGHKVTVHVTMPRLAATTVAGSGTLTAARAEGDRFTGTMAGSGKLVLGTLRAEEAKFEVAGSGSIAAAGSVRALSVSMAGSGDIAAANLHASSATVSIAGSGGMRAAVAGPAKVSIMGSGDVDLGPQARCTTTKMGSGSVRCG